MSKGIKDLGFVGVRKAIGKLVIQDDIEPAKTTSEVKNGVTTKTEDFGRFKRIVQTKDSLIISDKFTMKLGVDVNGSITWFNLMSEDTAKLNGKKKIRIKVEGKDKAEEKEVKLEDAKKYWNVATNSIGFGLLSVEELKELGVELQKAKPEDKDSNWLRFVTNKDLIVFLCANRNKLRGRKVEIDSNINLNVYNGSVSTDRNVAFLNAIKTPKDDTEIHTIEAPVIFANDSLESVKAVGNKDKAVKVAFLSQVKTDSGYTNKFVWTTQFLKLNKMLAELDFTQEDYTVMVDSMQSTLIDGKLVLVNFEVCKGSEESGTVDMSNLDVFSKALLNNPTVPQDKKDEIIAKLKATQKRGFAKEVGYIMEIKDTAEPFAILPEDYFVEANATETVTASIPSGGIDMSMLTNTGM